MGIVIGLFGDRERDLCGEWRKLFAESSMEDSSGLESHRRGDAWSMGETGRDDEPVWSVMGVKAVPKLRPC